ncbi:MAG: UbiX family flavin prenyltransferase [Paludisphaera borealis]|uniref:UbiX family flavin prenyltransferase n=1 Tax=Paludisphaera borealis TaxID=1387353 RepID=UPI00283E675E|nr:UbiX family flavin prenyltransferase [Paludisphaera borealis]MDR3618030.1 UbiX family flavin prenyltransferase [Paludisphaera borealis]
MNDRRRIIVGISGATGIAYGIRVLEFLRAADVETHLVVSKAGHLTRSYETDLSARELEALADVNYAPADVGAAIASGSFRTMGMVIAPCSIRTLAEVASCVTGSLLTRAADVCLKERRRVVLMVRETPLHAGHLRAMLGATEMGAVVMPPTPAFYTRPRTIQDIVDHTAARALDLFDIETPGVPRWSGRPESAPADDGPSCGVRPPVA